MKSVQIEYYCIIKCISVIYVYITWYLQCYWVITYLSFCRLLNFVRTQSTYNIYLFLSQELFYYILFLMHSL